MNEGVGSTTIIVIIMVFISVVSAYMAYNVNYTKAFRMKNKIISLYEEYDGHCESECHAKIIEYGKQIGYKSATLKCDDNPFVPSGSVSQPFTDIGYCEYKVMVEKTDRSRVDVYEDNHSVPGYYYRILTRIDIRIPIIQNVLQLNALNVTGDTKVFEDE